MTGTFDESIVMLHVMPMFHLACFAAINAVFLVGGTHVERVAIRLRVDGDGRDPELPQRAEDPNRNLATVGDEHLREAGHDGHIVSLWGRPIS